MEPSAVVTLTPDRTTFFTGAPSPVMSTPRGSIQSSPSVLMP